MAKTERKICPSCEAEFPATAAFCPGCGVKMAGGSPAKIDDEGLSKLIRKAVGDELDERGLTAKASKKFFDW